MAGERVCCLSSLSIFIPSTIVLTNLVVGLLKGYDQLMNLVLDDVKESMRGEY